MRLGKKKEKDRDGEKEQCIDGVARLICSAKQSHPVPLRGKLEGCRQATLGSDDLFVSPSIHRWHGVDGCEVLPALVAMADPREELSGRFDWRAVVGDFLSVLPNNVRVRQPASQENFRANVGPVM